MQSNSPTKGFRWPTDAQPKSAFPKLSRRTIVDCYLRLLIFQRLSCIKNIIVSALQLYGIGDGSNSCAISLKVIQFKDEEVEFRLSVRILEVEVIIPFQNTLDNIRNWVVGIKDLNNRIEGEVSICDDDGFLKILICKNSGSLHISINYKSPFPFHLYREKDCLNETYSQGTNITLGQIRIPDMLVQIHDFLGDECGCA